MILNKEILTKYKDYLILFDYPFIKQQNDTEIQKIFEKENRLLLLSWLMVKYLPSCNNKIEEAKKDNKIENYLINIIYENGFCRSTEKTLFVQGTLEEEKQITIFNKIFSMLSLLHSSNSSQANLTEEDIKLKQIFMKPSEELKKKIIPEINLFPMLGLPNKMTDLERKNKIDSYKTELENLKNILALEEADAQSSTMEEYSTSCCSTEEIEKLVENFKKNITEFNKDDFVNFTNNKTDAVTLNKIELENFVASNSKEVNILLKTLQKKKDLNKFIGEENLSDNDDTIIDEDFSAPIRQCFVMSNNIIEEDNRNIED